MIKSFFENIRRSRVKTTLLIAGAVVVIAVLGLGAVRLITGKPLGVTSFIREKVWYAATMVKAVMGGSSVRSQSRGDYQNIVFLHQSVGANLIEQGGLRQRVSDAGYLFWDEDYNFYGLTDPAGRPTGYNYHVPDDNTAPDGLANIFSQKVYNLPVNTFSGLLQHEVIVLKSCFTANVNMSDEQLAEYKADYIKVRDVMDRHPNKIFIIATTPPVNPSESTLQDAARNRAISNWLLSDEFLKGHPNIFTFDLFNQLAESNPSSPEYNMLRADYREGTDSHPNQLANQKIAPLFANFIVDSIKKYRSE